MAYTPTKKNNNIWKKYITPGIIALIIMGLVGFIGKGFSEDLKNKVDNKTIQMYIKQQEKQTEQRQKTNELKDKELTIEQEKIDIKVRELELKTKEVEVKIKILMDK